MKPVSIDENLRIPYVVRNLPREMLCRVAPLNGQPAPGDLALAKVERIGKNTRLELKDGRMSTLFEGDQVVVSFGNRYATMQFEGYAERLGDQCDLLSMAGVCGVVHSKCGAVNEPTKLRLLGSFVDHLGHVINIDQFKAKAKATTKPRVIVVCGSSMDSGKTHTAASTVRGLRGCGHKVAAIKLTGTASGRDTWSFYDSGARPALDFIDGGWPSTYLCTIEQLLQLHEALLSQAASEGAQWVVIEIADGLLQRETAALISNSTFKRTVSHWLFATGDPLAARCGVEMLCAQGIRPVAISGLISTRPLAMIEAEVATGVPVLTDKQVQSGVLNKMLGIPCQVSDQMIKLGLAES
ncbi:DUF1611 domain-containing protein [soil metagenome]